MEKLSHIAGLGVDFFTTDDGLNLKFIPELKLCNDDKRGGVTLTGINQDLQQSYLTAKYVFEHVKPGTIKLVLIGLTPYKVSDNNEESPIVCPVEEKVLADYVKLCLDNVAKSVVVAFPVNQSLRKTYKSDDLKLFRETIKKFKKEYKLAFIDLLDVKLADSCFQDRTHLSLEGGAAVSALLIERLYLSEIISPKEIYSLPDDFFEVLSKYFPNDYNKFTNHIFCKMACEHFKFLAKILPQDVCKNAMARVFSDMTYDHLANLSNMLSKDDYNDLAARIFKISIEKIHHKDKIKVGFVLYDSSTWCGNDLYNFFAKDERFEPTVFLCLRIDGYRRNMVVRKEFSRQIEQLKSNGLNVVALDSKNSAADEQDLIFYLIPYAQRLPNVFQLLNISPKTLLFYIPYSIEVGKKYDASFTQVVRVAWKQFFPSVLTLEMYNRKAEAGTPQRVYSGYPKMDIFYKNADEFKFDWKMARPNAKKIIWAPHHSIKKSWSIATATFQWNYQFMYDFAKAHPEISWIVKPHSNLPVNAVGGKVFPTVAAYEKYLKAWDELPNAQVYTGAYYQAIFATSDGLIHDCGSFTIEYQYVDKPMIYLTREGSEHNELGNEILKAAYTVDGKDFDAIAAMMQRVFIEGDDYKAAERKEVFDKYLNYPKANGMLASEFIYKSIADELKKPST